MALKSKSDFAWNPKKFKSALYKDPRNGIFLSAFMIRGRKFLISTGVKDPKLAQEIAYKKYIDRYFQKIEMPEVKKNRGHVPTVRELLDFFLDNIVESSGQNVSASSAKGYANAFSRIAALVNKNLEKVSLEDITLDVLRQHRAARYAAKGLNFAETKNLILNYSINSEVVNAFSVFSVDAMRLYKQKNWKIPEAIFEIKAAAPLPAKKPDFTPIPEEIDSRMCEIAAGVLGAAPMPARISPDDIPSKQVAVVFELARFCSLTSSEIQNMRWSWISADKSRITISGGKDFSTKRNSKDRHIPVDPARVVRWEAALPHSSKEQYVIDAPSTTERLETTSRAGNAWIKRFCPDRYKGLHEMRKMCTADFLRATNGDVYKVSEIIGDNPRTMLAYYAAVLKLDVEGL